MLGIAFSYEPVIPGTVMGGIPPEFIESQRAEIRQEGARRHARFEQATKRAGISARNPHHKRQHFRRRRSARPHRPPLRSGRRRPAEGARSHCPTKSIDEGVLFESGRPVIFVPFIQKGGVKLDRMMVCWDGSRAAARAIADAMPFLKKAKQVEIVIVADKPGKERRSARRRSWPAPRPPRPQGGRQAHHLARHRRALHHPVLRGRIPPPT